jgi:hypothetical protein
VARPLVLALLLLPAAAFAHPQGITGYSGATAGVICTSCHNTPGTPPTVQLTGPSTLMPGASATYTFTITGGPGMVAGLDVSTNGGATLLPTSGTYLDNGELTQSQPQPFSGGSAAFSFTVTAPPSSATVRLFAAGLSANNNNLNSGDQAAATTLTITVGSAAVPDAGMAPMDAGTTVMDAGMMMMAAPPMDPGGQSQDDLNLGGMVEGGCSASGALPELAPLLALLFLIRRLRG